MTGAGAAESRLSSPRATHALACVAALAAGALAAVWVANDAGVAGASAVPVVARVAIATVAVFLVCGYAPAALLTPAALRAWWPLLVLPLGAITSGMALTLLGFAAVPFHIALALTLVAGIVAAARVEQPRVDRQEALLLTIVALACAAALVVAIALVPTFRSGLATVTGFGSDAHLVAGSATFLQHNYPASTDVAYPADQVPPLWRSKFPIYYTLAAVSSVAGVEPWEALMTVAAILLALTGLGFFLLARRGLGAPIGVAAAAMAVAVLDRRVFHLALHPYYNQLWGMLTLPFTVLAAYLYAVEPSRRALALFVAFGVVGAFAYPLMLPFPLLAGAGAWWLSGRRIAVGRPSRRSLLWIVPVGLLLLVPVFGVIEKIWAAVKLLVNPGTSLIGWQGDLQHYPPVGEFFAIFPNRFSGVMVLALLILAFAGLWRAPRALGRPLLVTLAAALAFAVYFHEVRYGQYFYFKVLSFSGPLLLIAAIAMLGSLAARARMVAFLAIVALVTSALLSARSEIKTDYDQLSPETIALRDWAAALPAGASIRLDTPRAWQLWDAYMLSSHPLGSRDPITNYPHVPVSAGADFVLDRPLLPPPPGAVGAPVDRNARYRLWRLGGHATDTTSRRMVPIFSGNDTSARNGVG
ncbi:MAG: hypothetical protein QOJ29_3653 [Thermoleophilaceae bacterium]|nr:hypothetical protein [Thermoleophilaceae bacterium]